MTVAPLRDANSGSRVFFQTCEALLGEQVKRYDDAVSAAAYHCFDGNIQAADDVFDHAKWDITSSTTGAVAVVRYSPVAISAVARISSTQKEQLGEIMGSPAPLEEKIEAIRGIAPKKRQESTRRALCAAGNVLLLDEVLFDPKL